MADATHTVSTPPSATRAAWDAAHAICRARQALHDADVKFGANRAANGQMKLVEVDLKCRFGSDWRSHPEAKREWDAASSEMQVAEDAYYTRSVKPLFDAQLGLLNTPAPDLDAVQVKIEIIADFAFTFDDIGRPPAEIIAADVERLTGVVA